MKKKSIDNKTYDAVIIGSGANGIAAAIYLQQKGLKTLIVEGKDKPGGASRTEEITLPGFKHDVGSAVLPMAFSSPFFSKLPLEDFGLEWVYPEIPFVQTYKDEIVACYKDVEKTAQHLGKDRKAYLKLMQSQVNHWGDIAPDVLGPLGFPSNPLKFLNFGIRAILPANILTKTIFKTEQAKALFYGAAAHSTLPLSNLASSSFGLVLIIMAHLNGWPLPKGGASSVINALIAYYKEIGGHLQLNTPISSIDQLPKSKIRLFDVTPKQLLDIEGLNLSNSYRKRLGNYNYGAGVFKIDWALDAPIPFLSETCKKAGTIHIGFDAKEIFDSEKLTSDGKIAKKPYVLLVQPSVFDDSRAPDSQHTAWAYCHVPHGSLEDCTEIIEAQIEKTAPGFKKNILARKTYNTHELEVFNPNIIGGDINGGKQDITQLFTRPVVKKSPYRTSNKYNYICSSSTPPGGGVHGMGGFNAAKRAYKDHFK